MVARQRAVEPGVLGLALRQSERVIDHQVRTAEEADDKSEQLIALGISVLGGALFLVAFLGEGLPLGARASFLGAIAAALGLNGASILLFLWAYHGFRRGSERHVGPDPGALTAVANDPTATVSKFTAKLLRSYADYFRYNSRRMANAARRRLAGIYALLAAIVAYGTAILLILT